MYRAMYVQEHARVRMCVCVCGMCLECLLVQPLVPVQAPDQAAEPVAGLV